MSLVSRVLKKVSRQTSNAARSAAARRRAAVRCVLESLESRQLLTVTALTDFTPTNTTGAVGTSQLVELTRFVDFAPGTGPGDHTVRMTFPTGSVDIQTFDQEVPRNVANFLRYVRGTGNRGYEGTYFHRFLEGFVAQGGSFYPINVSNQSLGDEVDATGQPEVTDEVAAGAGRSNTRGTLAFARRPGFQDFNNNGQQDPNEPAIPGGGPNSATSGFFFNLADNGPNLNFQNGGFDVFGQTVAGTDANGQPVADPITILEALGQRPATQQLINDAVVLLPNVTFNATSSNPSAVQVVNPQNTEGRLRLQYVGAPGSSSQITVTAADPGQATPVTLTFTATVTDTPATAVPLGGPNGARQITFTDADGTVGTLMLRGQGSAAVNFTGTGVTATNPAENGGRVTVSGTNLMAGTIAITGSGPSTVLQIRGQGGTDGFVTFADLTADGPVRAINAPGGCVTNTLVVNGPLGRLTLGVSLGGDISLGGTGGRGSAINIQNASDTNITSSAPIRSLRAGTFSDTDTTPDAIRAPAIGSIAVNNDFVENVDAAGALNTLRVGRNLTGSITAESIRNITVAGDMIGSTVRLTQPFAPNATALGSLRVNGAVTNSTVRSNGRLGNIQADSLNGANFLAGIATNSVLPSTAGEFVTQAAINNVRVRTSTANSNIAASTLGRVALGQVQLANNGTAFGLASDRIVSVTGQAGTAVPFRLRNLDTQADVQNQTQGSLNLQDARITLV